MKKQLLILFFFIFQITTAFSQQYLNFDFEKESVEGYSRPWGWALDSWGTNVFSMDTTNVYKGKFSLRLQSLSKTESLPSLQSNLEPYIIAGKKITLKGNIDAKFDSGKSFISFGYASVDDENNYIDSSKIIFETTDSTVHWEEFEVSFVIPKNVFSVFIKIGLEGKGTIWYDNLNLIVNEINHKELAVSKQFSNSEKEWITANVQSFKKSYKKEREFYGFDFLESVIGNSRVLALGESTHGTSEFFKLKHHVFKYAVNELGFRVFALEDNQLACEKVNQYVLGKASYNSEQSMSGFFAVWYRTEMKDLIEWIKKRNEKHPDDPVYFAGYDMQDYKLPLKALKECLIKNDNTLLSKIEGFESFASNVFNANDSLKQDWLSKTTNLFTRLKNSSSKFNQDELQYANLLKQFTENVLKGHWSLYRDEAMAENIIWLANVKYPEKKIFVWAHDIHVSKSNHSNQLFNLSNGIAMGHFLKESLKDNYKTFGLMTYSGAYLALKSYTNYERVNAPLYLAPEGSLEEVLHQISLKKKQVNLFLDFKNAPKWIQRPLPFRFINHVNSDYGFWQTISIPNQFDGIFFIDKTNPSNYLKKK